MPRKLQVFVRNGAFVAFRSQAVLNNLIPLDE